MKAIVASYGSAGQRHVQNLNRSDEVQQLSVLRRPTNDNLSEDISGVQRVFFDLQQALAWNPDFAIIASPAPFHVELGIPFVNNGVHVLVEKPLAASSQDAERLIVAANSTHVIGMVGYNFRFYQPLVWLKNQVDSGVIGRVVTVRAEVGSYLPNWRDDVDYRSSVSARSELGGGALLELSHELDLACWFGGSVSGVAGVLGQLSELEIDVEDTAEILLEFDSGGVGNIHLDLCQSPPDRWVKVIGTRGTAFCDVLEGSAVVHSSDGEAEETAFSREVVDWNAMYEREIAHFIDCITGEKTPRVSLEEGLAVLEIVEAVRRSSIQGEFVDP